MAKNITCRRCGVEIGNYVAVGNEEFLQVGGVLSRELHGVCAACGLEIHWSVSDRALQRLIEKVMKKESLSI